MLKAVLFDLDNTLVDRDRAWAELVDACAPNLDPALRQRVLHEDAHGRRPRGQYVRWLEHNAPQVLAHAPKARPWAHIADAIALRVRAFDLVAQTLEDMQGKFRMALVSDGSSAVQHKKLHTAGLTPYFEVVVVSEEVGVCKPSPRPFEHALEQLGVKPEQAVFVGDHPVRDVQGAARLGMTPVWRRHGPWPADLPKPRLAIDDVHQLQALLS